MANTVFILGAGASKQSGTPLMGEFLDVANELLTSERVGSSKPSYEAIFKAISALQSVHSKSKLDIVNMESVFTAFEMARTLNTLGNYSSDEIEILSQAMKEVIVSTIENKMLLPIIGDRRVAPPLPYEQFIDLLSRLRTESSPKQTVAVITFNYDLGPDYACYWERTPIWYGYLDKQPSSSIPILKLHGSMNWAFCKECNKIIPWDIYNYFSTRQWNIWSETKYAHLSIGSQIGSVKHEHEVEKLPMIVPPTWNKSAYYSILSPVWTSAAKELKESENIIVIGYSLPESDIFFRYLFALATVGPLPFKRFWVFNPDSTGEVKERFQELLGTAAIPRYKYFEHKFNESFPLLYEAFNIKPFTQRY